MKKIILLLVSVCVFSTSANAAFYLNPGISLGVSGDLDISGIGDLDNNPSLLGVQTGYGSLGFSFGLDYETTLTDLEYESGVDGEYTGLGIFLGYEFPILLRVWGTYMLSGSHDLGGFELEGLSGTKLGIGYTGLPMVSLNVELRSLNFDEIGGATADVDFDLVTIGVSIPLSL